MTPTRRGSNYSIQQNGSGPGHSSQKSKRPECHPRGEAQMEDARASTRSFDTLIESQEADITAIPVVRPESFTAGRNRNIPVSVQELLYGGKAAGVETSAKSLDRNNELSSSSEEVHGPRKDRRTSQGLDTHVLQGRSPTDESLVEKPKHVVRGPEEEVDPTKGQQLSGSSQASTRKNPPQQVPNKAKKTPKRDKKGKQKAKGKAKSKWNKPYSQNYGIPKKEKTAMENVFNMARTFMESKKRRRKD
ncbi:hypothetical protein O181_028153 [Austropuccinia psidii MF-1]|uniref:Uncharacterized protein n=1 Tax=Austropuccinia psidii MF-1 TaxID=1389203 RepID=A0A9Q3H1J4_9BASI|nr:hypothetical protein [Austropuccinia psidii MF-1]